jgi:hypothetical protein
MRGYHSLLFDQYFNNLMKKKSYGYSGLLIHIAYKTMLYDPVTNKKRLWTGKLLAILSLISAENQCFLVFAEKQAKIEGKILSHDCSLMLGFCNTTNTLGYSFSLPICGPFGCPNDMDARFCNVIRMSLHCSF